MGSITISYASIEPSRASIGMPYTVTFYALSPGCPEAVVTVHKVSKDAVIAYTGAPGMVLEAARSVRPEPRADGFRVVSPEGKVVLDYVDRAGRGDPILSDRRA